jgi:hypothetical protein
VQLRAGAFVLVAIAVANGCVGDRPSPSPEATQALSASLPAPTPSAPAGQASVPASNGPTAAPGEPLTLTVDQSLEASLPTAIGIARLTRHTLHTGEHPPIGFSDALGRSLLASAGTGNRGISVAWGEIVPEQAAATSGLTIVAVRIPGSEAQLLRYLVVADQLLRPGASGSIGGSRDDGHMLLYVGDALVMSSGDTIYILSFPGGDAGASPAPASVPPIEISESDLVAAFPPLDHDTAGVPNRSFPPIPSAKPGVSPEPALAAEALLPDRIGDTVVRKISARGAVLQTGEWIYVGLPAFALYQAGLDIDPLAVEAAAGHPDGPSTFWMVVTRLPGHDARALLGAWFHLKIEADLIEQFETVEVNGRLAVVAGTDVLCAVDGAFYWMTYLDLGDFPPATQAPRPALRDVALDALRAIH